MSQFLYVYASRGIQEFVLRGTKLKEMVGASELIEDLSTSVLPQTLHALDLQHKSTLVSQAAGAARILFDSEESARRLAALWPMVVSLKAPGLQIVQAIVKMEDSILETVARAERQLAVERNLLHPTLPVAGAFTRRCPRTGNPAVEFDEDQTPIDAEALAKRRSVSNRIVQLLDPDGNLQWPSDFSQIAGSDNAYIAIIHADGNAFGKLFLKLQQHHHHDAQGYSKLCNAITEVTQSAAQLAVQKTCVSPSFWPGRVLVLAGDDLTAVVRADKALDFTRTFLTKFTDISRDRLASLQNNFSNALPQYLTASAGIAFVKKSYPFIQAYHLAESLCKFAKKPVYNTSTAEPDTFVPPPAALTFHRVTTSTTSHNYQDILETELTTNDICLTMMPYGVNSLSSNGQPSLDALLALVEAARSLPRGKLRSLLTSFYESAEKVKRDFDRMIAIAKEKNQPMTDTFLKALYSLTGENHIIASKAHERIKSRSPIADLLTIAQIEQAEQRRVAEQMTPDEE